MYLRWSAVDAEACIDVGSTLLERVVVKLSTYPHCHELEVAVGAQQRCVDAFSST